jgi:hypothetical protein
MRTMSALPPYWVRFELRKKLVVVGWPVNRTPLAASRSWNASQPSVNSSGGSRGMSTGPMPPGPSQVPNGAVSGSEPAT